MILKLKKKIYRYKSYVSLMDFSNFSKISADLKNEFDGEPVYNKEYLKAKIKSHGDEVTGFLYQKKFLR